MSFYSVIRSPTEAWDQAVECITQADIVIVIGTSLQVSPVNRLPFLTRGKLMLLNAEMTGEEDHFHVVIQGRAKESLLALDRWVKFCEREESR